MKQKPIKKSKQPLACVILAAGLGTRMRSTLPKVLHPVAGVPMIRHVVAACEAMKPQRILVVVAPNAPEVAEKVRPHACVVQSKPLGTGDAAKAARQTLKGFKGDVLVLFGDAPLMTPEALKEMCRVRAATKAAVVVAGFMPPDPSPYGRLVLDAEGGLQAIVETREAAASERAIRLCNGGVMLFEAARMGSLLDKLRPTNSKREYYLTDAIQHARARGWTCAVARIENDDVRGVNSRVELAEVEACMQRRLREKAMLAGATLIDPSTVYLSADAQLGRDVTIGPHVVIGTGVSIADSVEIRPFCHIEQTRIETGAIVGPFARLRPNSVIGKGAHIGNFVETKNTHVAAGAKINHLSYVGDASVGEKANIGAGTITCNYDGFRKMKTQIGAGAFIGSNTALVAPVSVGSGAYVGAGSVIDVNVPADALAVARAKAHILKDGARRYREKQRPKAR